ncbi:MAG: T9SS type A sorting domain-containing protein [Candidatus Latescibacteria bacterium]|nr:T9SS type A sorting domain-containing protein [Candidatus Latescibacterota bacterium]
MNTQSGDQGQRSIAAPNVGDTFTIDVVATRDAIGLAGYQVVLEYDATHFNFERFDVTGIFAGASPITIPETGRISINAAFLGSGPTAESSGSVGQATFSVLEGFSAPSSITLTTAVFSTGTEQETLELGAGSGVAIGIEPVSTTPSSDFNGDGEVGFPDFIMFAQAFGATTGDAKYDARFDLDSSGDIGFSDFITFAQAFGKPAGKITRASKIVGPNINGNTQIHMQTHTTNSPEEVELTVQLSEVGNVQGYGLQINYDPSVLAFSGATNAHASQFATDQSIALLTEHKVGTLHLSDVLQSSLNGNTDLAHLRFRVIAPTATSKIEISEALVASPTGQIATLGVKQTDVRAIPNGYALNQNHPNPFNPDTIVPFSLPQTGEMHLAIYNTLGQEIRLLTSGIKEAGFHRITWDGKNQNGQILASGIYFVRLQAGSYRSVRKMMLLK